MKKKIAICLLLGTVIFVGLVCFRKRTSFTKLIPLDDTFRVAKPADELLKKCEQAAAYSEKAEGLALLVIKGEDIVFEKYHNGHSAEKPQHLYSGTKSFTGLMYCAAHAEGFIKLDDRVQDILPELQLWEPNTTLTIKHLLSLTSGYPPTPLRIAWDGMRERQLVRDKYAIALSRKPKRAPGERYRYGCTNFLLFGKIIKRKTREDPLGYLEKRVLSPIGFRYAGWIRDPKGNPMLSFGCWTTAREWAKFGVLVRDDGLYKGKRIIPKGLIKKCLVGSSVMPAYGLTFWLNKSVPQKYQKDLIPKLQEPAKHGPVLCTQGPSDLVAAAGYNGNRCYVIPSMNLVIVRLGTNARTFSDDKLLTLLLGK